MHALIMDSMHLTYWVSIEFLRSTVSSRLGTFSFKHRLPILVAIVHIHPTKSRA